MPRSFVGIDPYLEAQGYSRDLHHTFLSCCRESLTERLPENYEAFINEETNLVNRGVEKVVLRKAIPDVGILRGDSVERSVRQAGSTARLEPVTIELPVIEEVRDAWIEIYRRPDRELVSVVELLSPSNKEGTGHDLYLAKRNALLAQRVHLIELDLLVQGERFPMRIPLPKGDYYAFVSRLERRPTSDVYAWRKGEALPTIPVPLKAPDGDVALDLSSIYSTAYERGRYAKSIDYSKPPAVTSPSRARARFLRSARRPCVRRFSAACW